MLYVLGEAWWTLDAAGPLEKADAFTPRLSGSAALLAEAFAARGGPCALLSQLGDDPFGHRLAAALANAGVDTSHLCFTPAACTPLVFAGGGELLPCRSPSAELLYAPEQLPPHLFAPQDALAFSSACLVDSPMRHTHLAALAAARDAGALVCFVPCLRPALWPGAEAMAETVRLFLPRADVVVLAEQELPPLFRTDAPRAALWHLLRGHTRLVVLAGAEGVHAFTRERLAFRPGPCPGTETLAAGVLRQLSALGQAWQALPKLTQAQLDALLSF